MERLRIATSGQSNGNPGPAAIGVSITDTEDKVVREISESIGNSTDDCAAYLAVLKGLQTAVEMYGEKTSSMLIELKMDNQTVSQQISAQSQITHPGLVPYFIEVHNMKVTHFPKFRPVYVSAKKNQEAIDLVNKTLDS